MSKEIVVYADLDKMRGSLPDYMPEYAVQAQMQSLINEAARVFDGWDGKAVPIMPNYFTARYITEEIPMLIKCDSCGMNNIVNVTAQSSPRCGKCGAVLAVQAVGSGAQSINASFRTTKPKE